MAEGTQFITQPDTGGFSDFLDRRRKRRFVSQTGAGIEEDSAVLGQVLDSEANRQSQLAQISSDRKSREDALNQQQNQFNAQLAAQHNANRPESSFRQAIGPAVGFAGELLNRGASNRLASAVLGTKASPVTTAASIGKGILKFFGF